MPLYRDPQSPYWYIRFTVGGNKVRRSSGTTDRIAAEELESRLRADLWRQVRLGEKPVHTWTEAVDRWYAEARTRGREFDKARLDWFDQYLKDQPLQSITRDVVDQLRAVRLKGAKPATANRYLAMLRMILRKAHRDWEWTDKLVHVPMHPVSRPEPRYLTRPQFAALKRELPVHLAALAEFSVETGLRMRNATGLTWGQVDMRRQQLTIPASRAKGGETIAIPLSARAMAILRKQRGRHDAHVFTFRGEPVSDANGAAFVKAKRRAGLDWLRWHDLRHTWASWQIQAGVPPHVLQELGGWKSVEMVRRYGHLSVEHLRSYVKGKHGKSRSRS